MNSSDNMISISYVVIAKDEVKYLERLIPYLIHNKRNTIDEIVMLLDDRASKEVIELVERYDRIRELSILERFTFKDNFADIRNYANSLCTGDIIFQIDADEIPSKALFTYIPNIFEKHKELDLLCIPRMNTVDGITEHHIKKWGWRVSSIEDSRIEDTQVLDTNSGFYKLLEKYDCIISEVEEEKTNKMEVHFYHPLVNWPDYQTRVYRNKTNIKWQGKVHEQVKGFGGYAKIQSTNKLSLLHKKEIVRQERQNKFYNRL